MAKRVKNALRPHEVEEDLGIPGKLYFEKPQLVLVSSFHKPEVPEFDTGPTGNARMTLGPAELYETEQPCRLKSSHKLAPTHSTSFKMPEKVKYLLTRRPTQRDADDYIGMFKTEGFGEGAIVARRYAEGWRTRWHSNWGYIDRVVQHVPYPPEAPWNPYLVKWFDKDLGEEWAWAEDLIVIHAHLDRDVLTSIIEAQP